MADQYSHRPEETERGQALRIAAGIGTDEPPSTAQLVAALVVLEPCCHLSEAMLAAAHSIRLEMLARTA